MKIGTKDLTSIALLVAVTIILSQIVIPLQPVPISLSMIAIYLSGGLLGWKKGAITQIIYIGIGAIGLPVFASAKGGIPVLFGPTGGYIVGYLLAAIITGFIIEKVSNLNIFTIILAMVAGIISCYILGTVWLGFITEIGFYNALFLGVIPFILGDILKIIVAAILVKKIKTLNLI
ncbi:biotin transporter BioY [Alkalibaculum sporogenes]|nr:biotin transporter BioY [Alkalibaculum sporogenes]